MAVPRITKVFAAVNIGSFRTSAMIAGLAETGDLVVLGSGYRASAGIKRGYVVDSVAATHCVRDAIERAERAAGASVQSVWIGCAGAGLASSTARVEVEIGGRRIEADDIEALLLTARGVIAPQGRHVLHAQPAHYTLDGAHGVPNPKGLHAERLAVDVHVMQADAAPIRNLKETVEQAHLRVAAVVGSPVAAGLACLTPEERDIGVALVEFGAEVTTVSVYAFGMLLGMQVIAFGSGDITDALASAFGIRRSQAERLKCRSGSAVATPADHRELIPVNAPGDPEGPGPLARNADDQNRIPRSELIGVIIQHLGHFTEEVGKALKVLGFTGVHRQQVVITGGGAQMPGLADFAQRSLGRPVRIGVPPAMLGLPPGNATPSSSTLVGLLLYAAAEPADLRKISPRRPADDARGRWAIPGRIWRAVRDYF